MESRIQTTLKVSVLLILMSASVVAQNKWSSVFGRLATD
jgi:hypothetical protein